MKNKNYCTTDLYLGAFLKARGVKLLNSRHENGKVFFVFQDDGECEKLIQDFLNNQEVKIGDYLQALDNLKKLIFRNF
ncbi:MAG: DUF5659 domain-containing protein [Acidobacteriota bacterium]